MKWALAWLSVVLIIALTCLQIVDGPRSVELAAQAVLVLAFASLTIIDLRFGVAIALVELAVAGAGGQWTLFPGGIHGRIVLLGIITLRATATIVVRWIQDRELRLGRYGRHAAALAVVMPLVWMSLGIVNGNDPRDVFADGDGQFFLAFSLALIVLMRDGHGKWIRNWVLIACAANALVTGLIILISAPGWVPLEPTLRQILADKLLVGNAIGYMPNGAYRLYLASGLYLQVGLALTTGALVRDWRRVWAWALYALLWVDVLASYTRGFWIGSALAVAVVLVLGSGSRRASGLIVAGTLALALAGGAVGSVGGFSLVDYVFDRAASTLAGGGSIPGPTPQPGQPLSASPVPGVDTAGELSNHVRVVQAQILLGHIQERPLVGYGFGAIASDYPYGTIFSYELSYLDLWYKTGLIGVALFMSFPLRLLLDAFRGRFGRLRLPDGVDRLACAPIIAILASILIVGATNPYILSAFGLCPIIMCIAWLDPLASPGPDPRVRQVATWP